MPQFLYRLGLVRLGMVTEGPTADEGAILRQHLAFLQEQARTGKVVLAGRTTTEDERVFGVAVLETVDEAEARTLMESDPAVKHGLMLAELFPFRIAVQR